MFLQNIIEEELGNFEIIHIFTNLILISEAYILMYILIIYFEPLNLCCLTVCSEVISILFYIKYKYITYIFSIFP